MLRSMIIGLAIAALLQFGASSFAPAPGVSFASQRIDWASVQATTLARLVCGGCTFLTR